MRGQVIFSFIYDLGAAVDLDRVGRLLNEHPAFEPVDITKTAPRYVDLPRPLTLRFLPLELSTNLGLVRADLSARIHGIGAVAFSLRIPIEGKTVADLTPYSGLRLLEEGEERPLESATRALFREMYRGLEHALVEHYPVVTEPEPYVLFALTDTGGTSVVDLLHRERRALAGLLSGERNPDRLAPEEVEDNLRYWFRYYEDDLVVVDWDIGLIVEPSGKYEDVLYVIELANLQLLELRTYDRFLDNVLEKTYDDLNRFYSKRGLFLSARGIQQDLSDARLDLIRVTDDVNNIGKIFGDWYLAKVHMGLAARFHLAEWEKIVNEKMSALNELYALATHEVEHRRGVLLEMTIILLFVIDLVLIFFVSAK